MWSTRDLEHVLPWTCTQIGAWHPSAEPMLQQKPSTETPAHAALTQLAEMRKRCSCTNLHTQLLSTAGQSLKPQDASLQLLELLANLCGAIAYAAPCRIRPQHQTLRTRAHMQHSRCWQRRVGQAVWRS